jgi:hypothetical protein
MQTENCGYCVTIDTSGDEVRQKKGRNGGLKAGVAHELS